LSGESNNFISVVLSIDVGSSMLSKLLEELMAPDMPPAMVLELKYELRSPFDLKF
jgi:hypothetical protein